MPDKALEFLRVGIDVCPPDNVAFPKWHQDILEHRENLTHVKSSHYTDWRQAKKDIEKRVREL